MKTGALIVAAGMSTRMKELKQLMKIGDLSMAERVVLYFKSAGIEDIVMVTGFQADVIEESLKGYGITFLRNEDYATTQMFDSVKIGLSYLKDKCDRIMFCPVDVPMIAGDTVKTVLEAEGEIILPMCGDRQGHPVRINSNLVDNILEYDGNCGLKGAMDALEAEKNYLEVTDVGTITDADKKEDYEQLKVIYNSRIE